MRALNGRCAMTRAEKNARRRELDKDPFHHSLTRKVSNAWREKNRDRINAGRRKRYAEDEEYRAKEQERRKKFETEHPEKKAQSWKKWADKNREYLRRKYAERSKTPKEKARMKRQVAERKRRRHSDPEYAEHIRKMKRDYYNRTKNTPRGLKWYFTYIWLPKWKRIVSEGPDRVEKYMRRCNDRTRMYFKMWQSGKVDLAKSISTTKKYARLTFGGGNK